VDIRKEILYPQIQGVTQLRIEATVGAGRFSTWSSSAGCAAAGAGEGHVVRRRLDLTAVDVSSQHR
jgi:hypothetical protein